MIPIDQTTFGHPNGNCFQAVIASMLELPLECVPHFCEGAEDSSWWGPFMRWLQTRSFSAVELDMKLSPDWCPNEGQLCWLVGCSPRNKDWKHAVVGEFRDGALRVVHDPHSSRDGIAGAVQNVGMLVPLDPRRLSDG